MPNQQLLDYIKQQMQLGVPQDAIKNALLQSGWPPAEVEEALKPIGGAAASPVDKPVVSSSSVVSAPKIDSVSKAAAPSSPFSGSAGMSKADFSQPKEAVFQPTITTGKASASSAVSVGGIKGHMTTIILGAVIVLLLASTGYLYARNSALSNQLSGATAAAGVPAGSDLSQQVAALTTDKTSLQNQLTTLTSENSNLKTLLNFFALPNASAPTSSVKGLPFNLNGVLAKTSSGFSLTTPENVVLNIKNSKTGDLAKALEKFVGIPTVGISGTYDIGSSSVTVEKISNQTPSEILTPPVAATTTPSTATTTPPAAATTTPPAVPATTTPPAAP